jgi:UDP-2,3-diacylglucosamine hydrolase
MQGLAIIAGRGDLPRVLAEACIAAAQPYKVVRLARMPPDWLTPHPVIEAEFEQFGAMFAALRDTGCKAVVFAGGMDRPNLDLSKLDDKTREILPALASQMAAGDGATLRAIADIFEAEGFVIKAAQDVVPSLLAPIGPLGSITPSVADQADITRAALIVTALGSVDVGQGAVVAQGLCLGAETLQGTDVMLDFVARTAGAARPDPTGAKGVMFKGPRPGQDLRMDMPAIGPSTIENAARAGLAGVAVQAGKVLILDRAATVAKADQLGLFLFGLSGPKT